MASYEYICIECDLNFTKTRGMTEQEPEYFCESCGYKLNRVYSSVGITFNGSGFYSTDNRK